MKSLFNINNTKSHLECNIFLDDENNGVALSRFEQVKYPRIMKFRELQDGFYWRPMEVELTKDEGDYKKLSFPEQHIFKSNILFQSLLDSTQSRAPSALFACITTLPEVEHFCEAWAYYESIHAFSYTYILRTVLKDPSIVFDNVTEIEEIVDRANSITKHYDKLNFINQYVDVNGYDEKYTKRDHKVAIWRALMAANILEGIRFYVSFVCSWAFAEQKKMVGNATVIKFIRRDENVHLGFTQYLLKTLPKDDPDYIQIAKEEEEHSIQMFVDAINQEKEWAAYLFQHGSMLGLTEQVLCDYVDYIGKTRIEALGMKLPYHVSSVDPLPWARDWISGNNVQSAAQETELDSYITGVISHSTQFDGATLSFNIEDI